MFAVYLERLFENRYLLGLCLQSLQWKSTPVRRWAGFDHLQSNFRVVPNLNPKCLSKYNSSGRNPLVL